MLCLAFLGRLVGVAERPCLVPETVVPVRSLTGVKVKATLTQKDSCGASSHTSHLVDESCERVSEFIFTAQWYARADQVAEKWGEVEGNRRKEIEGGKGGDEREGGGIRRERRGRTTRRRHRRDREGGKREKENERRT